MAPFPDPVESIPLGGTTLKVTLGGPPSSKWQEIPPWDKALKPSHTKAFGQDSDLVREARREFFSKHSYIFVTEATHDLSEIFKQMATSTELLGTSIYEIQASWTGPEELKQANYALRSLCKGLSSSMWYPLLCPQSLWDWWEYTTQMPFGASVA